MKLLTLCIALFFTSFITSHHSGLEEETFVAYVSMETTSQDLAALESTLIKKGIAIDFSSAVWDERGQLQSVKVLMYTACPEDSYDVETTLSVSTDQIGVIFKGEECQSGAFNVIPEKLDEMVGIFFRSSKPTEVIRAWKQDTDEK